MKRRCNRCEKDAILVVRKYAGETIALCKAHLAAWGGERKRAEAEVGMKAFRKVMATFAGKEE